MAYPAPDPPLRGRRRECETLERLLTSVAAGRSGALVLQGEAGMGKSALLDYVADRAAGFRVERATGVDSEIELAFAGLHQLCAPMLDHAARLPAPQRSALLTAFGLDVGPTPDRFLVGLAALNLMAEAAESRPLVCIVDDAQWLDAVSAQVLSFVARRLLAEPVGLVLAHRDVSGDRWRGLPTLTVEGLGTADSRALLESALPGAVDPRVRDRIVAESRGNPLALLELPRGLTVAEITFGFVGPDSMGLAGRIESGFIRRLDTLPADARRLLLAAAVEPFGDVTLLRQAIGLLDIGPGAATAAEESGLVEFGARVEFRHPLVRSALFRTAPLDERRRAHRAIAGALDPATDPDRRAWHLAHAATGPDAELAAELGRSAGRARARGGHAAAASFLEQAARLTPDAEDRARAGLAAARSKRDAGSLEAALALLSGVEAGPPDEMRRAEAERLRGQIAFDEHRTADALPRLLHAAQLLEPLDARLASETYLEAVGAAMWARGFDGPDPVQVVADAVGSAAFVDHDTPVGLVLDGIVRRMTEGYTAAAPVLVRALEAVRALLREDDAGRWSWLGGNRAGGMVALELWDFDARMDLAVRQVEVARATGALVELQFALHFLANTHLRAGELAQAAALIDEDRRIAAATGISPVAYTELALAALRGDEVAATTAIAAALAGATSREQGRLVTFATYAGALLDNGTGRHEAALVSASRLFDEDLLGYGPFVVPELAEAASRAGDPAIVSACLAWLDERARATPSDWLLGMRARVAALAAEGDAPDELFRESVERLRRTPVRLDLARSRLLHGEWLRRQGRRVDAREHLRPAHEMLSGMGVEGFAERARRELTATGETVRRRTADTANDITPQESQIARLAIEGHTNPEIGAQLFLSPRTVEWHLRKVFRKLGIGSRKELARAFAQA